MTKGVTAVVGGQYGSEGKGKIVAHIADDYAVHVRSGGPNAGHTIYHEDREYKMQQLPCGWVNPSATLVLARGALVDPDILVEEMSVVSKVSEVHSRVMVDSQAHVLDDRHRNFEGGTKGEIHQRIGSTGEGVGAARSARLNRQPNDISTVIDYINDKGSIYQGALSDCVFDNTPAFIEGALDVGQKVLLEGTQGFGLSLTHGYWPYVTSHDTTASTLLADAGISPLRLEKVIMVVRTFPIRVAGNSGPLENEITWEELSKRIGRPVQERTTVTKKVRRVGLWDEGMIYEAVRVNGPTEFALTFADYLNGDDYGVNKLEDLSVESRSFIQYLETSFNVPVTLVGTGPRPEHIVVLN